MESIGYQTILERNLLPFVRRVYPDGHRMWQDNDPKHTSNSTKKWMKDNGIDRWVTPPESPVSNQTYIYDLLQLLNSCILLHVRQN
jgi:hypothetical protein